MNRVRRAVESRFQRLSVSGFESWGVAPGFDEGAPLALEMAWCGRVNSILCSAEGAIVTDSLGQRPRISTHTPTRALKARFNRRLRPARTGRRKT
jgi:hypothetical protein